MPPSGQYDQQKKGKAMQLQLSPEDQVFVQEVIDAITTLPLSIV